MGAAIGLAVTISEAGLKSDCKALGFIILCICMHVCLYVFHVCMCEFDSGLAVTISEGGLKRDCKALGFIILCICIMYVCMYFCMYARMYACMFVCVSCMYV